MSDDRELEAWQQAWREQATPEIDLDRLREQTRRRNRREKWLTISELLLGAAVTGFCLWAAFVLPDTGPFDRTVFLSAAGVVVGFSAWAVSARRRHWKDARLDGGSLLRLEQQRIATRVRYWRISGWVVCAMWVALATGAVLTTVWFPEAGDTADKLFMSTAANLPVLLVTIVVSYQVRQKSSESLRRLRATARQLNEE